ncbi:response regulator transcription factor [Aliicoccus persicus]|uniref:Response regulator SaeR n=1 Tax=Aliicoccus persicus TaxID=930138 RepID=A0A662Z3C2_9STAP|nr:response regulator transcription factor [Aliicoccus persicus]SEW01733.1 DNA-binding response regulator, OmpR family, contains REC and winged-helix (wHTH) domain [Aliicoccus persicus]
MKKVLIVEDDQHINNLLLDLLSKNKKVHITQAYSGTEAKRLVVGDSYDLILLDLMLPGLPGEEFIKEFRKISEVPIIVITAKSEIDVLADVFKLGANDYIAKPFNTVEVLARVEAQLRKTVHSVGTSIIQVGPIKMNEERRQVTIHNEVVNLTQKEYEMLKLFLLHPKKVYTKANLYESVWQEPYIGDDNTISVHMSRLRSKLTDYSDEEIIQTVWGVGFKLALESYQGSD